VRAAEPRARRQGRQGGRPGPGGSSAGGRRRPLREVLRPGGRRAAAAARGHAGSPLRRWGPVLGRTRALRALGLPAERRWRSRHRVHHARGAGRRGDRVRAALEAASVVRAGGAAGGRRAEAAAVAGAGASGARVAGGRGVAGEVAHALAGGGPRAGRAQGAQAAGRGQHRPHRRRRWWREGGEETRRRERVLQRRRALRPVRVGRERGGHVPRGNVHQSVAGLAATL
jgi:hypothetical protein